VSEPVDPAGVRGWPPEAGDPAPYYPVENQAYGENYYDTYRDTYLAPPPFAPPEQRAPAQPWPPVGPVHLPGFPATGLPAPATPSWAAPGTHLEYPAPSSGHRRMWAAVLVLLVIIAGAVVLVSRSASSTSVSQRDLVLPPAADGYHQRVDNIALNLVDAIRDRMGTVSGYAQDLFDQALIGMYSRQPVGVPEIVFIGVKRDTNSQTKAAFDGVTPSQNAAHFMDGAGVSEPDNHAAGPLGGTVSCGTSDEEPLALCVWFDASTMGIVMDVLPGQADAGLARLTLDLRGLAEH
jgi:hypothetical protein